MSRDATLGRIRLRHLQCFLAVAQAGTLRGAAQALSVTQPAITKTLNELEELLGTPLFVRDRKGAALTPAAHMFLPHANTSLQALRQAIDSVAKGRGAAPVVIGVLPTLAPSFVPALLRSFAAAQPGMGVQVHTGRNKALIEMLRRREVELVIGRLSEPEAMLGVSFEHLCAEPLVVVLRRGHPLARSSKQAAALSTLASRPLVLPLPGTMIRQLADGFLASHGIAPHAGSVETLDTALARALVLDADHVWLTPLGAVQRDIDEGLMLRLEARITPEEPVGVLRLADSLPSPGAQAFLSAARRAAALQRRPDKPKARHNLR